MAAIDRRYTKSLEPFYDSFDPQFLEVRRVVREVLQKEADLQEIVQLVGKARRELNPDPNPQPSKDCAARRHGTPACSSAGLSL